MFDKFVNHEGHRQVAKYVATGGTAFACEYISFLILFSVAGLPLLAANTISFLAGFLVSFTFNRKWTFKVEAQYKLAVHHQLAAYLLLSLFNLIASNIVIYFAHKLLPAAVSKILAVGMIASWNFIIYRIAIFKSHSGEL